MYPITVGKLTKYPRQSVTIMQGWYNQDSTVKIQYYAPKQVTADTVQVDSNVQTNWYKLTLGSIHRHTIA